jgi:colanic acid/amylovoran biosynthesis protein
MTKVLLTGTYCSYNKGDAAMELATAKAILKQIPESEVAISSPFPQYDEDFYAPIPVVWCSRRRLILATMKLLILLLWRGLKSSTGINLRVLVKNAELQHFLTSDVIVDLSGDMLTEDYGVHVAYSHYLPLLMALAANKPFIICAQSIGPFKWTKFLARFLINRARAVTVRDPITRTYLAGIGIQESDTIMTADMAFLLEPCTDERVDEIFNEENICLSNKKIIGISLSALVADKFNKFNAQGKVHNFEDSISGEIIKVCKQYHLSPMFVAHVTGPVREKDDRITCQQVANKVQQALQEDCQVLRGNYKPDELKGIIGRCFLFAGARMHANIAALSSGVPVLAISYSHKTPGIMQMFSQGDNVSEIEKIDSASFQDAIKNLIENHDSIASVLEEKLVHVKAASNNNIELVRQALASN